MDFNDTTSEAEFRVEARDWLASQVPKREPGQAYAVRRGDDALLPLAKEWQAKKFEANFAGINLPRPSISLYSMTSRENATNYLVILGILTN